MEKAAREIRESFLTSSLERLERSVRSGEAAPRGVWGEIFPQIKNMSESANSL